MQKKLKDTVQHFKRHISMFLCLALLLGCMADAGPAAKAAQDTAATYVMEGAILTHEVQSAWTDGYNAQVTITNTGSSTIENWSIKILSAPGTGIDSIWNALIQKETKKDKSISYDICNPGWSRDIAPGESVSFGYQGKVGASFGEGDSYAPLECCLTGKQYDAGEQDYQLLYRMVENWESGGIVEAAVRNLTEKNMENWKLSFSWQGVRIEEIWDAAMTEKEGRYYIKNAGYNYTIPAKDSVAFRMKVQFSEEETAYPQDGMLTYDAEGVGTKNTPEPEKPEKSPSAVVPATSPAVAATEAAAETETLKVTEEMRRWNRTMLHMDDENVQKALATRKGSVKVALLDSGVDEMESIPVAGRVNLIPGENGMTEFYEDATGHGTAIAGLMAYHYKNEEDILEEKCAEYDEQCYEGEILEEGEISSEDEEEGEIPSENDETPDAQTGEEEDADTADAEEGIGLGEFITMSQARFEGINPDMELYSLRVLDAYNETPVSRVIEGIRWARENDIRLINISFGTSKDYEELHKEIKKAYKEGILIIAAAGNDGKKQYPAAYKEVLGVGSVDYTGHVEECCEKDESIELSAPGEGVLSVGSFGVETEVAGTSMAAGEVTAIASILWQQNPTFSNKFIRSLLAAGANACDGSKGYGIVDLSESLAICEEFQEAYEEAADVDFEDDEEGDGKAEGDSSPTVPKKEEEAVAQDVDALLLRAAIEKKEEAPATTEAMLKASWGGKTHLDLVEVPIAATKTDADIIRNAMMLLKIGARLQDGVLCNLNNKKKFPTWHGYFKKVKGNKTVGDANYIAGYMYLTRLAENIHRKKGYELGSGRAWNSVIKNSNEDLCMQGKITKEGINYDDSENNDVRRENLLKKNRKCYGTNEKIPASSWINIFRSSMGEKIIKKNGNEGVHEANKADVLNDPVMVTSRASVSTKAATNATEEQALVVYGMGLHTMTDVFAHSCRAAKIDSVSVKWKRMNVAKDGVLGEGKKEKYNDSTKVVPNRVVAASKAAINALNHIRYKDGKLTIKPSKVMDFYSNEDSNEKKDAGTVKIVQIKDYICKAKGKSFAIRNSYLKKAFTIVNFKKYIEECKEKTPKRIRYLDCKFVRKKCNKYKVVYFKIDAKQGEKVNVRIKYKGKPVRLHPKVTDKNYIYVIVKKNLILGKDYTISCKYRKKKFTVKSVSGKEKATARMGQGEEQEAMLLEEAQIDYKQTGESGFGSIKRVTPSGKVIRVPRPQITLEKEDGSDRKSKYADGYGFYNISMLHGAYCMTVEKEGYMPLKKYLYSIGGQEKYMDDLFLYPLQEGKGNLEGKITNGPAGEGLSSMYLTLREGYDNTGGQAVASAYTDVSGNYKIQDIPAGYYCVEFEDRDIARLDAGEGYEDNYFNIFIESGKDCCKNSYAYRRFEAQNTLELVVHWTKPIGVDQPYDTLRLYLFGLRGANEMYLYDGLEQKIDGEIVAETIFNHEFVPRDVTKRMSSKAKIYDCSATSFMFYVASNRGRDYLPLTDAVAEVYYDGKLIQSFTLPKGDENYWEVCTYNAETGEFTPGNRLVDSDTFQREARDRLLYLAYGEEKPYEE